MKLRTLCRPLCLLLSFVLLTTMLPLHAAAETVDVSDLNAQPVETEEWVYEEADGEVEIATRSLTSSEIDSAADTVVVHVTATDRESGETVYVEGATVCLYVGTTLYRSAASDADGTAIISLKGLSANQRKNATVSAKKVVSRGKALAEDDTARDQLFEHFPTDDNGNYYRYTMELHSETIDFNGNWLGETIATGNETGKVDIVFVIDATGSMGDDIANVKDNVAAFSRQLIGSGLDIRLCIIDYRDITEGEETFIHTVNGSHWITEMDTVIDQLYIIDAEGGGDYDETLIDALGIVADDEQMHWRSDANRFAFVLTDATVKNDNRFGYANLSEVTEKLAEMQVVTSVITKTGLKSHYNELISETGGIFANIASSSFGSEMMALADSIVTSVTREMTLELSEPRLLVNLSACYVANDEASLAEDYEAGVKATLNEYANRLAEATDGHVLIDKVLLFSTESQLDFYDTNDIAAMADIHIETKVKDDGIYWFNVKIRSNSQLGGFFFADSYVISESALDNFSNLKNSDSLLGRRSFRRIALSGTMANGPTLTDDSYLYSLEMMHETGHYLLMFKDEYLNYEGTEWETIGGKPYDGNYGLMDNQYIGFELSTSDVEYAYMGGNFEGTAEALHTAQSWLWKCSCEDTLADILNLDALFDTDFNCGDYLATYTKVNSSVKRYAGYSYAGLSDSDFLLPQDEGGGGGSADGRSLRSTESTSTFTQESLVNVDLTASNDESITLSFVEQEGCTYGISVMKVGEDDFTEVETVDGCAELAIAAGELAELRVTFDDGEQVRYNTYYIDRSGSTATGYFYSAVGNAVMAYVTTDADSAYTFIADNTAYVNGEYFSVNQATRVAVENGSFTGGEIYSVADCLSEIDYSTMCWFKYADGKWTALDTDLSEDENHNIGARADLDGAGTYVLMAKVMSDEAILPAQNLAYTQSAERDAVVTLTFDDPNENSKYYNVYYSSSPLSDKAADGVIVRSFNATSTALTLDLIERGRTVYAAVEIVAENGARSELSDILLIGGEADSDGDGIPDWYNDLYHLWGENGEDKDIAGSDDDGDGLTNLEEFLGGSDPTDANDPYHTSNVAVEGIAVSTTYAELSVGESLDLTATITPSNATNLHVVWSVDDSTVLSVEGDDAHCTVTALRVGETKIYAVSADGGYSAAVTVSITDGLPFSDVTRTDWYYDAVSYVYENELMVGISATRFRPDSSLSRAMLVTVLWRMAGSPTVSGSGFADVQTSCWYTTAVAWAREIGIVFGYDSAHFGPEDDITREQLVTILYRYAQYVGADTSASGSLSAFTDANSTAKYARPAMQWAVAVGLLEGDDEGFLLPRGTATRAQSATLLMRFHRDIV